MQFERPLGRAAQRGLPRGQIDSILTREIRGQHGPMESHKPSSIGQIGKQGGNVAVTAENLWMALDLHQVEHSQKIVCAVSAAGAQDRAYLFAYEHFF